MEIKDDDIYDFILKVLLVGDSGVGKTNIVTKYIKNEFNENSKATVGVEFCFKKLTLDDKKVNVQIWDTAGQEKFRSITASFYKGAKGAFIVFDITNKDTFENIDKWVSNVTSQADKGAAIVLIGNKTDLEDEREVTVEEAQEKAKAFNMAYMETSAKSGHNLNEAFELLIRGTLKRAMESESDDEFDFTVKNNNKVKIKGNGQNIDTKENNKGGCC